MQISFQSLWYLFLFTTWRTLFIFTAIAASITDACRYRQCHACANAGFIVTSHFSSIKKSLFNIKFKQLQCSPLIHLKCLSNLFNSIHKQYKHTEITSSRILNEEIIFEHKNSSAVLFGRSAMWCKGLSQVQCSFAYIVGCVCRTQHST